MGYKSESIFNGLRLSEDDRKDYTKVKNAFMSVTFILENTLYNTRGLNFCDQQQGESVEQYVKKLNDIADSCAVGNSRSEQMRDRTVGCILDKAVGAGGSA